MEQLFTDIREGNVEALLALFENGQVNVNLPSFGVISNNRIFSMFVQKVRRWMDRLNVQDEYLGAFCDGNKRVARIRLYYRFRDVERNCDLIYEIPVGIVCDLANGKIRSARVYAAMEYAVGKQILRPAFLQPDPELKARLPELAAQGAEGEVTEPCAALCTPEAVCVEENVLMIQGDICTPQARLRVIPAGANVAEVYGEIVWDFKLWPTLY